MNHPAVRSRDGFVVRDGHFPTPPDTSMMDPVSKRKVTICHLFANYQLTIADIVRILEERVGNVINTLIEKGLIQERRTARREPIPVERRRSHKA